MQGLCGGEGVSLATARVAPEKADFRPALPLVHLPGVNGTHMGTYSDLLRDPRWQKARLKKLEAAEWRCEACMDGGSTLHVHHKRYIKGRMPWEYEQALLVVLCESCHEAQHDMQEIQKDLLARLDVDGPMSIDDFFGYGVGGVDQRFADEKLRQYFAIIEERCPNQVAAARFASDLSNFGLSADSFATMSRLLDGQEFFLDLYAVLRKHGVPMRGDQEDAEGTA